MFLILYTRQGCHLCEDFEQEVRRQQQLLDFAVEIRDVDTNPDWGMPYNDQVPLLLAGSVEISRYFFDPGALRLIWAVPAHNTDPLPPV